MLELITNNQLALEDLHELHTFGKGSLLAGIAKAIGGALSVVTEAGNSVIHSVGGALSDVFTSVADGGSKVILSTLHGTAEVIDNTGKAIKHVEKGIAAIVRNLFGSLSGLIVWIYLIVFTVYVLLMQYRSGLFKKCTQHNPYSVEVVEDTESMALNKLYTPAPCVNCKKN